MLKEIPKGQCHLPSAGRTYQHSYLGGKKGDRHGGAECVCTCAHTLFNKSQIKGLAGLTGNFTPIISAYTHTHHPGQQ